MLQHRNQGVPDKLQQPLLFILTSFCHFWIFAKENSLSWFGVFCLFGFVCFVVAAVVFVLVLVWFLWVGLFGWFWGFGLLFCFVFIYSSES